MSSTINNNTNTQTLHTPQDRSTRQSQFNQFSGDVEKQLQDLELNFAKQISELRKRLSSSQDNTTNVEIQDETNSTNNTTTNVAANKEEETKLNQKEKKKEHRTNKSNKPLSYSVSYSSSSSYKDGVRDVKERIEFKDPETNIVADRLPGKEEFEVKTLKHGEKEATTQRVPANQLKSDLDSLYGNLQHKFEDEFSRFGFPFGNRSGRSLFGSTDLPMLESSERRQHQPQAIEEESSNNSENRLVDRNNNRDVDVVGRNVFGSDFFRDEIMNIEREMEMMRRRMDWGMRSFFDF
jgi:hypothetical protein